MGNGTEEVSDVLIQYLQRALVLALQLPEASSWCPGKQQEVLNLLEKLEWEVLLRVKQKVPDLRAFL